MDTPAAPPAPEVVSLRIAESPEGWAGVGFAVDGGRCRIGGVTLDLVGPDAGDGVVGWGLRHLPAGAATDLDGFPTTPADGPTSRRDGTDGTRAPGPHPCGVTAVDHIVLLTDDLDRTVGGAAAVGLTPRRWRDHALPDGTPVRQAFFVVGEMVLELVAPAERPEHPRPGVRSFGIALVCPDLAVARAALGPGLGSDRPAVQPGRRIATVRHRDLGLRTPIALMTPRP
ncbi:MAG TPA: hypothetical protein VFU19_11415 [Iamia sp.]|nr:hypothetical protein [Iamia sp.]